MARWAIVLAGGDGRRLQPLVRRVYGSRRPKQFCSLLGEKTLLESTLDRLHGLVPPERTLIATARAHRRFLTDAVRRAGTIVEQPLNRETAPGVFLPAAHALRADPGATLMIVPSDHFISEGPAFLETMNAAAAAAELRFRPLVLVGAVPDSPERDYGWIEPGEPVSGGDLSLVRSFKEKPDPAEAKELYGRGCLWNTMLMAVSASALWELGRRILPEMTDHLDHLTPELGMPGEEIAVLRAYIRMGCFNFSSDFVEKIPERILTVPLKGARWSDLGRPGRVMRLLAAL